MHLLPPLHHQVTNVADILSIWEFLFAETKHSGTSQVTIIWLSQTINIGQGAGGGLSDFSTFFLASHFFTSVKNNNKQTITGLSLL